MGSTIEDLTNYQSLEEAIARELNDKNRFVPIEERRDTGVLPTELMASISHGKYMTCWRGVSILKDPLTLIANQQLLWELKPPTVIEFGAWKGGSALWTADMLKMFGCKSRVISIDIDLSLLDAVARESPDVEFVEGDLFHVEKCLPGDFLKSLPHPWFLMEDSHVNMTKVLEYFDAFLERGDYICIEDTTPAAPNQSGQGLIKELGYTEKGPAKLNELKKFLMDRSGRYHVDQRYTDLFGYNATWNMNGYLKRI
ncbi:rhamnosyl O-methyltransferase-like [Oculina patagonica]